MTRAAAAAIMSREVIKLKIYKKSFSFNIYLYLSLLIFVSGVINGVLLIISDGWINAMLALTAVPLLFVCVFFAFRERNCHVFLDDDVIYIGSRVFSDEKEYNGTSVTLMFSKIERVTVTYYRVQGKKPRDENMYHFHMKDGSEARTYFYDYGEKAEKEILAYLEKKVRVNY